MYIFQRRGDEMRRRKAGEKENLQMEALRRDLCRRGKVWYYSSWQCYYHVFPREWHFAKLNFEMLFLSFLTPMRYVLHSATFRRKNTSRPYPPSSVLNNSKYVDLGINPTDSCLQFQNIMWRSVPVWSSRRNVVLRYDPHLDVFWPKLLYFDLLLPVFPS